MKGILVHTAPYYEYLAATFFSSINELGYQGYNYNHNTNNYTQLWNHEEFDFYMDFYPGKVHPPEVAKDVPKVLVWTYDNDDGDQPFRPEKFPQFDIYFVRELKEKHSDVVYPMNYGIEDRYYCAINQEDKRLIDRSVNCSFYGSYGGGNTFMGKREQKLNFIRNGTTKWNSVIGKQWSYNTEPDEVWSRWVNGRFCHDNSYFRALADCKIILSPSGGGSEGGRHYEAIAAHSLPLIERSHNINIYPHWEDVFPEIVWDRPEECVSKVDYYLSNLDIAQDLADRIFEFGKSNLRAVNRAQFILNMMKEHKLI